MTPPSDEVPEQEPEVSSDNVFDVDGDNPKFVFDKPRPDDNPIKPDGIPGNINWDSMDRSARMEYLQSWV